MWRVNSRLSREVHRDSISPVGPAREEMSSAQSPWLTFRR
jgi:hypothetical protein